MGRLADLYRRRRLLLIGLGVFVAGSVGGALAPETGVLLICRAASSRSTAGAQFGVFTVAYLVAAALCLGGAAIVLRGG